ncbi:MAG: MBOAT family O-acyltransferase [Candidatus Falkowbacteria bacterium]
MFVNKIYGDPEQFDGPHLVLATIFFGFQIYCDFSGYSDIAIGAARVMGYDLMKNFRRPYAARSVADFWRRWHISLSTWFQDYIFNPLYFYISKFKALKNLDTKKKHWLSFIVSIILGEALLGLWHGADWTFVLFGLYYAFFIILYYATRKWWDKMFVWLQTGITFTIVTVGWVFFRANTPGDAHYIITNLFKNWDIAAWNDIAINVAGRKNLLIILLSVVLIEMIQWIHVRKNIHRIIDNLNIFFRWSLYYALIFAILLFGVFGGAKFIYFDF